MLFRKFALAFCSLAFISISYAQSAENYQVPRTEYNQPDLQGVWSARFNTPLERPNGLPLELSDEQAQGMLSATSFGPDVNTDPDIDILGPPTLASVRGVFRSSIITYPENGKLPYNDLGQQRSAHSYFGGIGYDGPEQRPGVERCVEAWASPPIGAMMYKIYHGFVQTPDAIAIVSEEASQLRIIHMNGKQRPEGYQSFDGYSVGRWEGDSLVVETTHYSDVNPERATIGRPMLLSSAAKVTERFTRISDAELHYQYTVEDPTYYTEPWQGEFSFKREDVNHIYEYACHEGNYSMIGALRGTRVQETEAELGLRD
ncbi:MAG: hypothetical protein MI746_14140 [Pseudomonadales bacterium]|nr:hypothetical protein [Pseudomonadales bacterium]